MFNNSLNLFCGLKGEKMITTEQLEEKHYILRNVFLECDSGWNDLLDRLCTKIEAELAKDQYAKKEFKVMQVKEKFAGLRFYISTGNDAIFEFIEQAENESFSICEDCGKPGNEYSLRCWVCIMCKECARKEFGKWQLEVMDGLHKAQLSIAILSEKINLTKDESIELSESEEWYRIAGDDLLEIQDKLKEIGKL